MELDELLERVDSKETFLAFLEALEADWEEEQEIEKISPSSPYGPGAKGWENGDIGMYLDAMHAWTKSAPEGFITDPPTWKTLAWILYAGKFYE